MGQTSFEKTGECLSIYARPNWHYTINLAVWVYWPGKCVSSEKENYDRWRLRVQHRCDDDHLEILNKVKGLHRNMWLQIWWKASAWSPHERREGARLQVMLLRLNSYGLQYANHGWVRGHFAHTALLVRLQNQIAYDCGGDWAHWACLHPESCR